MCQKAVAGSACCAVNIVKQDETASPKDSLAMPGPVLNQGFACNFVRADKGEELLRFVYYLVSASIWLRWNVTPKLEKNWPEVS